MTDFISSFTPEDLTTWGAAIAATLGVLTVAVRKAAPAWGEIRRHLGIGEDESLRQIVSETRDLVRSHEERIARLEGAERPTPAQLKAVSR